LFKTFNYQVFILFLSLIRKFRLPDPYKGNGIRFYKEKIKFKKRKQFGSF
jgi:ribosomal protein L6P/L9E